MRAVAFLEILGLVVFFVGFFLKKTSGFWSYLKYAGVILVTSAFVIKAFSLGLLFVGLFVLFVGALAATYFYPWKNQTTMKE